MIGRTVFITQDEYDALLELSQHSDRLFSNERDAIESILERYDEGHDEQY
jgi:hypothetical protein